MNVQEILQKSGIDLAEEREILNHDIADMEKELVELRTYLVDDRAFLKYLVQTELDELKNKKAAKAIEKRVLLEEMLKVL